MTDTLKTRYMHASTIQVRNPRSLPKPGNSIPFWRGVFQIAALKKLSSRRVFPSQHSGSVFLGRCFHWLFHSIPARLLGSTAVGPSSHYLVSSMSLIRLTIVNC